MLTFSRRTAALLSLLSAALGPRSAAADTSVLATTAPGVIGLSGTETQVTLLPAGGEASLRKRLAEPGPDRRIFLMFRDLHTAAQPGVVYQVYFGSPPGAAGSHPVGTLNFFAVAPPNPGRPISRIYDVTVPFRTMLAQGSRLGRITVTIVANEGRSPDAAAQPAIGGIDLIIQ